MYCEDVFWRVCRSGARRNAKWRRRDLPQSAQLRMNDVKLPRSVESHHHTAVYTAAQNNVTCCCFLNIRHITFYFGNFRLADT